MKITRHSRSLALLAVTLAASGMLPNAGADERRGSHTHYYSYDSRGRKVEVVREGNNASRREEERRAAERREYQRRYEHSGYRERYDDGASERDRRHRGHDYNRAQALRMFGELLRR